MWTWRWPTRSSLLLRPAARRSARQSAAAVTWTPLAYAIFAYSSFTSVYAAGDPRRVKLGTPDEVFRSIERAWDVALTSKRIVEEILALPRVLSKIIEYKECVVPDEVLRQGAALKSWSLLR